MLCIRYIFLIYLGLVWAKIGVKINKMIVTLSIISLIFIFIFAYTDIKLEPFFFDNDWKIFHWISYFYPAFLLVWGLNWLYTRLSKRMKDAFVLLGKYSWEIFLMQMFVLSFLPLEKFLLLGNKYLMLVLFVFISFVLSIYPVILYRYTLLLREGLKVKYIPSSLTFYRQHADNLIGIGEFTVDLFKRLSILKLEHYTYLTQSDLYFSFLKEKYTQLVQLNRDQIELILGKIKNKYPLWWESINF